MEAQLGGGPEANASLFLSSLGGLLWPVQVQEGKRGRDEKSAEGWDICTYVKDQLRCSTILFLRLMTAAVVKRYTCTVKSSSISVSERGKSGTRPGVPVVQANRT